MLVLHDMIIIFTHIISFLYFCSRSFSNTPYTVMNIYQPRNCSLYKEAKRKNISWFSTVIVQNRINLTQHSFFFFFF